MNILFGVVFLFLAGFTIVKGEVPIRDGDRYNGGGRIGAISRTNKPVVFWLIVLVEAVVGGLLLFGVIHF